MASTPSQDLPLRILGRRRSRWWLAAWVAGGLLALCGGGLLIHRQLDHVLGESELDAELANIAARGESLRWDDLVGEPIPAEENAATLLLSAIAVLQEPDQEFRDAWGMPDLIEGPIPVGQQPSGERALNDNRLALDLLAAAVRLPRCQFQRDAPGATPAGGSEYWIGDVRLLARLLTTDLYRSLARGDSVRAVEIVRQQLDLAELLRDDPVLTSALLRVNLLAISAQNLALVVAHVDLTNEQMKSLDARLGGIEQALSCRTAVLGDRVSTLAQLEESGYREQVGGWWLRPGNLARDQAAYLRGMELVLAAIDQVGPAGMQAQADFDQYCRALPRHCPFASLVLPAYSAVMDMFKRTRNTLLAARIGLRVARYRAAHGRWPMSLEEGLGEESSVFPGDCFWGQSFMLETGAGFAVYSQGHEGLTDSADPERPHALAGEFRVRYASPQW